MAAQVRDFDWSLTPLGPPSQWSRSLKATVALLLNSRHPMFLWWGPQLTQIYNDAYVPSFGIGKHPAALGQPGEECWPEIWHIIGPQIADVMQRGIPSFHEDALVPIFRNGRIEDVYWTYGYSPVFDDDGSIGGTLVVCTETTGRVVAAQQEAALRRELVRDRALLQQFFAQAPAGICILRGSELVFESANDHYRKLVGGRDVVGKPLLVALPELQGQGIDALLHGVRESGEPFIGREIPARIDRSGLGVPEEAFYTFIYSPLREGDAPIDAVIVLALDVTEEVRSKQSTQQLTRQLEETEAKFRTLAETIPQLAWSTRPDGYIDWYNQRWYDYTGTTFESMQGWGWRSVHDPEMVDDVIGRWQAALNAGVPFEMEFPILGADGRFRWHLTQAMPLKDQSGQIVRWFGTNTDVDSSRRLREERALLLDREQRARQAAELASRAKDDFLATASHELRTPLNAILGWARMLNMGALQPADFARAVDSIERNARAQVRLIDDILDGSRIITGKLQLEVSPLDMTQVVQAALDAVRAAADAKRIVMTADLDPAAARLIGDAERLQQVVWNLVNNAIKFTPKDGAVQVVLRRTGADVQLSVSDNGIGITGEFLPYVFDRFRQAEGSTRRQYGGLGLGLALVRHLVEAHGGSVAVASDGPGEGATFTVTLPVQAVVVAAGQPPVSHLRVPAFVPRPVSLAGATMLVVDDEEDARDLVATVLRGQGAEVLTANSAAAALELIGSRAFAAMVSDIGMPLSDGHDLMHRVRALGVALPAVALTAYSREEDRRRALDAGFERYLSKPVEPNELIAIVSDLVAESTRKALDAPDLAAQRELALRKFAAILDTHGVQEALRFLNSRAPHRFTGIYQFAAPILRSVRLHDAQVPTVVKGEDAPLDHTYCSIVGEFQRPFATANAPEDDRVRDHHTRDSVQSYVGVLLSRADGTPFGSLCHFDLAPAAVPMQELALMEAVAPLLMRAIEREPH